MAIYEIVNVPAFVLFTNMHAGTFLNEETSARDYSEFTSEFAPFLEQIPGRTQHKIKIKYYGKNTYTQTQRTHR